MGMLLIVSFLVKRAVRRQPFWLLSKGARCERQQKTDRQHTAQQKSADEKKTRRRRKAAGHDAESPCAKVLKSGA